MLQIPYVYRQDAEKIDHPMVPRLPVRGMIVRSQLSLSFDCCLHLVRPVKGVTTEEKSLAFKG